METANFPIACLLLAAGGSRRMGRDKLSLPLSGGGSVLERTAEALGRVPFAERVIVVRERSRLLFTPEDLGFAVLEIGQEAERGMHRSLRRGLAALGRHNQAALVALGDQPFLRAEDYASLITAYREGEKLGFNLLAPVHAGRRGNPSLIHASYFNEVLTEPDRDQGARYLFERYPDRVLAWPAESPAFFRDLDTPEDYRACLT